MSERLHLLHYSLGRRRRQQKLLGSFICQVKDTELCYCHSSLFTRRFETCASACCIHTCSSERGRRRKQAVSNNEINKNVDKQQENLDQFLWFYRIIRLMCERSFVASRGAVLKEQNELRGKMTEFQMFLLERDVYERFRFSYFKKINCVCCSNMQIFSVVFPQEGAGREPERIFWGSFGSQFQRQLLGLDWIWFLFLSIIFTCIKFRL